MTGGRERRSFCTKEVRQIAFQVSPWSGWQSLGEFRLLFAGIPANPRGCWGGPQIPRKECSGEQMKVLCSVAGGFSLCKWIVSPGVGMRLCSGWVAWHGLPNTQQVLSQYHLWLFLLLRLWDPPTHGWTSPQWLTFVNEMISWTHARFLQFSIRTLNLGY